MGIVAGDLLEGNAAACLYSRSLSPGGVLLELAVVDGEVRPEVTAVSQGGDTAARRGREKEGERFSLL